MTLIISTDEGGGSGIWAWPGDLMTPAERGEPHQAAGCEGATSTLPRQPLPHSQPSPPPPLLRVLQSSRQPPAGARKGPSLCRGLPGCAAARAGCPGRPAAMGGPVWCRDTTSCAGGCGRDWTPATSPASTALRVAKAPALTHSWMRLTWPPALSSALSRVGPPQGGVHPRAGRACAAGQGHRSRLSHLAGAALPRRDLCRQPPDAGEELCHVQGVAVTESPRWLSPQPPC